MSERLFSVPLRGGWLLWGAKRPGGNRHSALLLLQTAMRPPDPSWPERLQDSYMARVETNLTGICPRCSTTDMTVTPVAPRRAKGVMAHEPGCPTGELTGVIDDNLWLLSYDLCPPTKEEA